MSTVAPWLLLLLSGISVDAQLRGDSTQRSPQEDVASNDTSVVLSYEHVESKELAIEELEVDSSFGAVFNSSEFRRLDSEHTMFMPLNCNARCSTGSTTWKQENYKPQAGKVTIPCGKCVTMNYDASDVLELPHGLNIEGKKNENMRFAHVPCQVCLILF